MHNKSHIIILAVSIIFCSLMAGATLFMYRMTLDKHQKVEAAHMEWKNEEDRRAQIRDLERTLEDLEAEQQELESHFARSLDVVPLLDTLEEMGVSAGALTEVSAVDRTEEGKSILVTIKASGSWSAMYNYILLLENSAYELEFTMLDVKRVPGAEAAVWEGTFKVKVLSFLP